MENVLLKRIGIVIAALLPVAIVGAFVFRGDDDLPPQTTTPTSTTQTSTGTTTTTSTPSTSGASSAGSESINPAAGTSTTSSSTTSPATTTSKYTDGTYTATGSYRAPDGSQSITVTLTVANDVVTKSSLKLNAPTSTASGMWQQQFASGYESYVVGKSLSTLKLTKVSGSSLTPIGFNAAVADIQTQAKS